MLGLGSPFDSETRSRIADLANEFNALLVGDATRLERYRTYRKELEAGREFLRVPLNENGGDYGLMRRGQREGREQIDIPLGQATMVKHTHRVAGRLPQPIVDRRGETVQERYRSDTMERMWWGMVRESGDSMLFSDGAWDASSLGSACFETYLNTDNQIPILRSVDPTGILVVRGVRDPHEFARVFRYWEVPLASLKNDYRGKTFNGIEVPVSDLASTHKVGTVPMVTIVQCSDDRTTIRFALGGDNGMKADKAMPLAEWPHELGFVPYVVIPNVGPYRDVWGWADYEFIRGLIHYIPKLISREADIIKAVANGAMIDKGTGEDPEVMKEILRQGGIISSRKDGAFEPVDSPEMPSFAGEHTQTVLELFKMVSFTPDAAWGTMGAQSGSDRSLQLQPMLELTQLKQANWSAGLTRLAAYAFQIIEKQQGGTAVYRGARRTRTGARQGFSAFTIGPSVEPETTTVMSPDPNMETEELKLPRKPEELFDGDYSVRFIWQNRIDPDDPAYVTSELQKFQQGAQSLRRTLENLGVENPEDEITVIEQEAAKYPWMRDGMIKLMQLEIAAAEQQQGGASPGAQDPMATGAQGQGAGGGAPFNAGAGLLRAAQMMQSKDGQALDADAGATSLPGAPANPYGGA